jgi:hypothetical protein
LIKKDDAIFKCYVTNVLTASQKINLNKKLTGRPQTKGQIHVSKRSNTLAKEYNAANNQNFINFASLTTPTTFIREDCSPSRTA